MPGADKEVRELEEPALIVDLCPCLGGPGRSVWAKFWVIAQIGLFRPGLKMSSQERMKYKPQGKEKISGFNKQKARKQATRQGFNEPEGVVFIWFDK